MCVCVCVCACVCVFACLLAIAYGYYKYCVWCSSRSRQSVTQYTYLPYQWPTHQTCVNVYPIATIHMCMQHITASMQRSLISLEDWVVNIISGDNLHHFWQTISRQNVLLSPGWYVCTCISHIPTYVPCWTYMGTDVF